MYWSNQPQKQEVAFRNPYGWKSMQEMNEGLAAIIDPIAEKEPIRPSFVFGDDELAINRFRAAYKQLYKRDVPEQGVNYKDFYKVVSFLSNLDWEMDYMQFLRSNPMATANPHVYSMMQSDAGLPTMAIETPENAVQQRSVWGIESNELIDPSDLYTADPYMPSTAPVPSLGRPLQSSANSPMGVQVPQGFWRGHFMVAANARGGNPIFQQLEAAIFDKSGGQVRARFFVPKVAAGGTTLDDIKIVLSAHSSIAPHIKIGQQKNDPKLLAELDLGPHRSGLRHNEEVFWVDPMVQGGSNNTIYDAYRQVAALHRATNFRDLPVGSFRVMRLPNQSETYLVFVLNVPIQTPKGLEVIEVPIGGTDWNVFRARLETRLAAGTVKDQLMLQLQSRLNRVIAQAKQMPDTEIRALNEILRQVRWVPLAFPDRGGATGSSVGGQRPRVRGT